MDILVKYPTRNRPHKFLQVFSRLLEMARDVSVLVSYDADDATMTPDIVKRAMALSEKIVIIQGESRNKIHACNRDIAKIKQWDVIVLMSDDMIPQVPGWDDVIREDMADNFTDTDGCLWYPDGYQDRICTMSVMGRKYYDTFNYIYHPEYTSLWSDNEYTEVALGMGKMCKSDQLLFKHEHPMNNNRVANDALYKRNEPYYQIDKIVYEQRKHNGFPVHY